MSSRKVDEQWSGGCEIAPMSTTRKLETALSYAAGQEQLIFRIKCDTPLSLPAHLGFVSCFPSEDEWLFPPLTQLTPTSPELALPPFEEPPLQVKVRVKRKGGGEDKRSGTIRIVDVKPSM